MSPTRLLTAGVLGLLLTTAAEGSALTFIDDYEGFVEAAPTEVRSIDFETLPDGTPSWVPAQITPEFNYTHLGATFLPHRDPGMYINGNAEGGFQLVADSYPDFDRNWIIAELVTPASAVGTRFLFDGILSAYASDGTLLGTVQHTWPGEHFLGIVSTSPIAYATIDQGVHRARSNEFLFADVPEPSTGVFFLTIGTVVLARYKSRRISART